MHTQAVKIVFLFKPFRVTVHTYTTHLLRRVSEEFFQREMPEGKETLLFQTRKQSLQNAVDLSIPWSIVTSRTTYPVSKSGSRILSS